MDNVPLRNGRRSVDARAPDMALFRERLAVPLAGILLNELQPLGRGSVRVSPVRRAVEGVPWKTPCCPWPELFRFVYRIGNEERNARSPREKYEISSTSEGSFAISRLAVRTCPPPTVLAIASSRSHLRLSRFVFRDTTSQKAPRPVCAESIAQPFTWNGRSGTKFRISCNPHAILGAKYSVERQSPKRWNNRANAMPILSFRSV